MVNVFAVPVFFIVFRETLETSIIVSVLLAFLKQSLAKEEDAVVKKKLVRQVWFGTALGFLVTLIIGAAIIGVFYTVGRNAWATGEYIWEGVFALLAAVIISIMGAALLRVSKLQDRWRVKLSRLLNKHESSADGEGAGAGDKFKAWSEKYAMFLLPFVTVLREGIEAILFVAGVMLASPASSFPIPTICGLLAGCFIGYIIYKGAHRLSLQIFLIVSTCFLYLVAAGLFSKGVWYFEADAWNKVTGGDAAEGGSGAGSYDIRQSVWHVNCCNPSLSGGGGWGVFNSLFGWQNSATYGSVISYNLYWLVIIIAFLFMRYKEKKPSGVPVAADNEKGNSSDDASSQEGRVGTAEKGVASEIRPIAS